MLDYCIVCRNLLNPGASTRGLGGLLCSAPAWVNNTNIPDHSLCIQAFLVCFTRSSTSFIILEFIKAWILYSRRVSKSTWPGDRFRLDFVICISKILTGLKWNVLLTEWCWMTGRRSGNRWGCTLTCVDLLQVEVSLYVTVSTSQSCQQHRCQTFFLIILIVAARSGLSLASL